MVAVDTGSVDQNYKKKYVDQLEYISKIKPMLMPSFFRSPFPHDF